MTATEFFGGVASVASFIFLLVAILGQFRWEIKGKSYRTHVQVTGAITGAILLFSLIFINWEIKLGAFYTFVEAMQIASIIRDRMLRKEDSKNNVSIFEAAKTAGKTEAEMEFLPKLAEAKAEGKAEGKAEAQEEISGLKVTLAEKDAIIRIYDAKLKK